MRIISKWRDYYDSLQNPQDKDMTFVRHLEFLDKKDKHYDVIDRHNLPSSDHSYFKPRQTPLQQWDFFKDAHGQINKPYYIGHLSGYRAEGLIFCGKLYSGLSYREYWGAGYDAPRIYYWDAEHFLKDHAPHAHKAKFSWVRKTQSSAEKALEKIFSVTEHPRFIDACFDLKTPLIGLLNNDEYRGQGRFVCKNPRLDRYQFYRKMDAHQTFQEISMFIGGVLSNIDLPEPATNKVKIEAHGFDYKDSFRKGPTKEHR
jgi:hypothetical protein